MTRRMRRPELAALLTVSILLAVAVAVAVARGGASSPAFSAPKGFHLVGLQGFVVIGRDDRTVTSFAAMDRCGVVVPNRLLATQSDRSVELALAVRDTSRHELSRACAGCGHVPCQPSATAWPTLRLDEPLSSRAVVQGLTGRPLLAFGASEIAAARTLPTGCRPGAVVPDDFVGGPPSPAPFNASWPVAHPGVMWTCTFRAPRGPGSPGPFQLQVGQWLGHVGHVGWPIEGQLIVQHRWAGLSVAEDGAGLYRIAPTKEWLPTIIVGRSIWWHEDGETFVVTSQAAPGAPLSPTYPEPAGKEPVYSRGVLPVSELVAIADGLRITAPR